jgi:hypothetical protein
MSNKHREGMSALRLNSALFCLQKTVEVREAYAPCVRLL